MKIKTETELFERIDLEFIWRRTEMSRFNSIILKYEKDILMLTPLLRSAIPILYAHWEGFIKESALHYFNYVSIRKLKHNEISNNFLALYLSSKFYTTNYNSFENTLNLLEFLDIDFESRINIKIVPEPIKTKSNLNSVVLREISMILGLDYEKFRGFEFFIDSSLLEARNKIAHGENREIDKKLYEELHKQVLLLMGLFRTEIENSVVQKRYLRKI